MGTKVATHGSSEGFREAGLLLPERSFEDKGTSKQRPIGAHAALQLTGMMVSDPFELNQPLLAQHGFMMRDIAGSWRLSGSHD